MDIAQFTSALNASQLEAVTYCEGPSLVIAGAGAGKTRVLTYKIAYLLQNGYEPRSILALTFTNKAAREMNERIAQLCENLNIRGLWSGTFHSLFARLLRMEHEIIGYPSDFSIYDTADSRSLLKHIAKELGLDDKKYKPNVMSNRISEAKNHLILPPAYQADSSIRQRDRNDGIGEMGRIYAIYQQRLRAAGAMDFDDLLLNTYLLLFNNSEVRKRYQQRFRYILVDEYQDTNMAQHRILTLLANEESHICVVGDDAQSIYGFRGADIQNILGFQEQYPQAKLIKLECNYRSTQTIVEAANCIIRNNRRQIPKKVYSNGEEGERIKVFEAQSDKEEASKIVSYIMRLYQDGMPLNEIALLYRTNAQSRVLEEAFQSNGIPYRVYGGLSFYQRKEIKDALAYFRMAVNPDDEEAFRRIINYPARGIGQTTLQKIQNAAIMTNRTLWQVIKDPVTHGLNLATGTHNKLKGFVTLISSFREMAETQTVSEVAKTIVMRSGMALDIVQDKTAESISRRENVDELLGSILEMEKNARQEDGRTMVPLKEYLASVSLLSDTDKQDDFGPCVTLMTVHAAKGLEFEAVFVSGMEQELFPNATAQLYPSEMEEERRLFYVAVTRAKRYCFLSYSRSRFRFGSMQFPEPSIFIDEIDEQYLERIGRSRLQQSRSTSGYSLPTNGNHGFENYRSKEDSRYSQRSSEFYGKHSTSRNLQQPMSPKGFKSLGVKQKVEGEMPTPRINSITTSGGCTLYEGQQINHERFGRGEIIGLEGVGENAKIHVRFENTGEKKLLLKFAKFTTI